MKNFSLRALLLFVVVFGAFAGLTLKWYLTPIPLRCSVLGPITSGGPATAINPPTDAEVIKAIGAIPGTTAVRSKQLISEYSDEERVYPLIGPARQHHATYQFVVSSGWRRQTVLVDHNHLHMGGN